MSLVFTVSISTASIHSYSHILFPKHFIAGLGLFAAGLVTSTYSFHQTEYYKHITHKPYSLKLSQADRAVYKLRLTGFSLMTLGSLLTSYSIRQNFESYVKLLLILYPTIGLAEVIQCHLKIDDEFEYDHVYTHGTLITTVMIISQAFKQLCHL